METIYAPSKVENLTRKRGDKQLRPKKNRDPKLSRIEQEVLKDIEKAFGIKVYSNRQELEKVLKTKDK